jgi:hypothetical protein
MQTFLKHLPKLLVLAAPVLGALATRNWALLNEHGGALLQYVLYVYGLGGLAGVSAIGAMSLQSREVKNALKTDPPPEPDAGQAVFSLVIPGVSVRVAFDEEAAATKECRYRIVGAVEAALSVRTDAEEEEA